MMMSPGWGLVQASTVDDGFGVGAGEFSAFVSRPAMN
jgi:hypothetical protein